MSATPWCNRCGTPIAHIAGNRSRCDDCMLYCRRCDGPRSPSDPLRTCGPCMAICPTCGGPRSSRQACQTCNAANRNRLDEAAKRALGGSCVRCGISDLLQWGHINDDAPRFGKTRKRRGTKTCEAPELRRIIATGRSDRLQPLCPNCNMLKQLDFARYLLPPTWGPLPNV